MKKYMVIILDDENQQDCFFTDDYTKAENTRMDACVSLGYYAEIYERITDDDGIEQYSFLTA